jgi:hypothetical protein
MNQPGQERGEGSAIIGDLHEGSMAIADLGTSSGATEAAY